MTRRMQRLDDYVRRLPLVEDDDLALLPDSDAKQALFEEITMAEPDTSRPVYRRARRRTLILATVLAVLALGGAGWAVSNAVRGTSAVACHLDDGGPAVVDSVSGYPVADCAAEWRLQTGAEPPALLAYDNGRGGIEVVPAGGDVPPDWTPLAPGQGQDPRVLELRAALEDYVDGLHADCYRLEAARAIAQREIERLGLDGWQVLDERGEADGERTCTGHLLHADRRQVVLIPMDGGRSPEDTPFVVLARDLGAALEEECLPLATAEERVRALAERSGMTGPGLVVHQVADDTAACTRADVNVGGRVEVTLRGPAT